MELRLSALSAPLLRKHQERRKWQQQEGDPYGWLSSWAFLSATSLAVLSIAAAIGPADYSVDSQTNLVMLTQLVFYGYGYLDSIVSGDLRWSNAHLSAVLDHDRRALLCGILAIFVGPTVVSLEAARPMPFWGCRVLLAVGVSFGILLTCLIRESGWFIGHMLAACLGFGSSLGLILLCALCDYEHGPTVFATAVLAALTAVTGALQGSKLLGLCHFPSWCLGLGEGLIVLCWGVAISQLSHA